MEYYLTEDNNKVEKFTVEEVSGTIYEPI